MPRFGDVSQVFVSRRDGMDYGIEVLMHGWSVRKRFVVKHPEAESMVAGCFTIDRPQLPPGILADWIEENPDQCGLPANLVSRVAGFMRRHGWGAIRHRMGPTV